LSSATRLRVTFHLSDAAAEWAGAALSDLFPDGLLLVPLPGGVTRLQGWLKAGRARLAPQERRRLALLGARKIAAKPQAAKALVARAGGRFPALRLGRFVIVAADGVRTARLSARTWPIVLVQGQAFGSGRHESTRLMIRSIVTRPPLGGEVLDVGSGSGILGFACLRLGAARVSAVEIESAACAELRRNRELNAVPAGRMPVLCGRFPLKRLKNRRFSLVLANIITPVLVDLMSELEARLAKGGELLCGGIHTDAEARAVVSAAKARGLAPAGRAQLRRWNILRFTRP
jgi:ribosomal protein L11 methyltransferase